jgi:hypothetical protein
LALAAIVFLLAAPAELTRVAVVVIDAALTQYVAKYSTPDTKPESDTTLAATLIVIVPFDAVLVPNKALVVAPAPELLSRMAA